MRITIIASGSRGDVQPLVALGRGLQSAGHQVRFATQVDFEPIVRKRGMDFFQLTGSAAQFFSGRAAIVMRERSRRPREFVKFCNEYMGSYIDTHLRECWEAAQDAEMLLCWPWMPVGPSIAEKLHIPYIVVSPNPLPLIPTWAFPNPFHAPVWRLGPLYNRLTWTFAGPIARAGHPYIDRWRREVLHLPPRDWRTELKNLRRTCHLLGYSPSVLPKPWDWGDWLHVTGYWSLKDEDVYEPPKEITDFLAAGPAPVAVGFSSLVGREPKKMTENIIQALDQAGHRGIFISGWGGLKKMELPKHILKVDTVPYDWLLPQVATMVHHGGSGTTACVIRAGISSVAVPFGYDQALWGRCISDLGIGVDPLPVEDLTAPRLAKIIKRIANNEKMRSKARKLAATIEAEDGIGRAVEIVEEEARRHRKR